MTKRTHQQAKTRSEGGQVLVLFALMLAGLCGFVGLAVDVGQLVATRTDLQKSADAAAFAGGQDLPSVSVATSAANTYVANNSKSGTTAVVVISQAAAASDTIRVTTTRYVNYSFLKVLGMNGANVSASATVRAGTYVGGAGLVPWGFIASNNNNSTLLQNNCYLGQVNGIPQFKQNQQCTLKYGAGSNSGGDFGSLALGGTGASIYSAGVANGSTGTFKVGDKVNPQTGNMVGPTSQGVNDRFAKAAPSTCAGNARNDVLIDNPGGSVTIRPGCESSPRIIIIPVVDKINNPQQSTILGFSFMYLTQITGNGGGQQVKGEFVKFVTELPKAIYQGFGGGARKEWLVE